MSLPSPATAPVQPEVLSLPVDDNTAPSKTNPRKFFAEGPLAELAASILTHGVLQPIVVRRRQPLGFEIIAGERRWRAAKLAKLTHVPAVVRQLTDVQVLEAQLIENGQREDIHPIEAGDTFVALQKLDGTYTVKAIASRIGKSERYVQNVLHYAVLVPTAKKAFMENEINAGHADLIARLKPEDQVRALKACFDNLYGEDRERGVISVRQLDSWIKSNVRLDVEKASANPELFPDLGKIAADKAKLETLPQVAGYGVDSHSKAGEALLKGLPKPGSYRVVRGKSDRCPHTHRAIVVLGDDRGKLIDICTANTECKKHYQHEIAARTRATKQRTNKPAATDSAQVQKARFREVADQLARASRDKVLGVLAKRFEKHAPTKPSPQLLALLCEALPNYGVNKKASSWKSLAVNAVAIVLEDVFGDDDYQKLGKLLKPFGLDLAVVEREFAPAPRPEAKKPAAPKATKQKPAREFLKKGVSAGVKKAFAKKVTKKPARKAGAKK